jgi:PncC family amidohydrolase
MGNDAPAAAARVAQRLSARGETLAVVETAAGGLISSALLGQPGASSWFLGSVVPYSAAARQAWLALPADAFGAAGAVSEPAAARLAAAVRDALGATWALAETGIAGPQTGRRSSKPAGLVYLAVAGPTGASRQLLTGLNDRRANQAAFAGAAIALLLETLERSGP